MTRPRRPAPGGRRAARILAGLAIAAALLGAACIAVRDDGREPWLREGPTILWPPRIGEERIRWLGEIGGPGDVVPGDLGISGFIGKAILGKEDARFVRPYAIAALDEGEERLLAVADPGGGCVHLIDRKRRERWTIEEGGGVRLASPVGLAFDRRGVLFVADSATARVLAFDRAGAFLFALAGAQPFRRPTGVAVDRAGGRVYVADTLRAEVLPFTTEGKALPPIGGRGAAAGRLNAPTHLATAPDGRLFVTDALNFRIQSFGPDGKPLASFGAAGDSSGYFARPQGVGLDRDGHVYVVDAMFEAVQIFDAPAAGARPPFLLSVGEAGDGPGQFSIPAGICVTPGGEIYVADAYNRRVQVFQYVRRA